MAQIDPIILRMQVDDGKYTSNLRANTVSVEQSLGRQERALLSLEQRSEISGRAIGSSLRGAIGGAIAALSAQQLYQVAKASLELASSLGEVSAQIGVTTDDLQALRYAGSQVGIEASEVDEGLRKLTKTIGDAATGSERDSKVLRLVGFSLAEIKSGAITAGDALPRIADFLAKIESPAQRAAVEVELFGRAGQKLDTLLSGGSAAIDNLRRAAKDLGLVLSEDEIRNADDTADKLKEVQLVLEADISRAVATNAQSIVGLASALAKLTGSMIKFMDQNPVAVATAIGTLAGARFGPIGAGVGAGLGYAAGETIRTSGADANGDIQFRKKAFQDAVAARRKARAAQTGGGLLSFRRASGDGPQDYSGATKEVIRQAALLKSAIGNAKSGGKPGSADPALAAALGDLNAPAGPKPKKSAKDNTAAQIDRENDRYAQDLARANIEELAARAELTGGVEARYKLEIARIDADQAEAARDLANRKHLSAAQRQTLTAQRDKGYAVQRDVAERERSASLAKIDFEVDRDISEAIQDDLRARIDLADSITQRRDLELELLAERKRLEKKYLESVLNSAPPASPEFQNALDRSRDIDTRYDQQKRQTLQRNETPREAYLRVLNKSAKAINEDLDRIAISGLDRLNDQLTDAIMNGKNLGDVFKSVANQIIGDLLRIAIQQSIIKPLANSLFSGGGFFGGLTKIFGRASGGYVGAGDMVRVNEGASPGRVEGFRPAGAGTIIPLGQMNAITRPANQQPGMATVRLELSGDLDARILQTTGPVALEVVRRAAPEIISAASAQTISDLTRTRL